MTEEKIPEEQLEKEIIDGKPHFGKWVAKVCIINSTNLPQSFDQTDPILAELLSKLRILSEPSLQIRNEQIVYSPPWGIANALLSIKFIVWGRAFKVMRYVQSFKKQKI